MTRYAWLSIAAALLTMGLKALAYVLTGSVGLLSDALESGVNLVAALFALVILTIVAQPPDEEHAYGHEKAEYFSSGVEGTLILLASVLILMRAIDRLLNPIALNQLNLGLAISVTASLVNFGVARVLARVGREQDSIALQADAQHLMTDVWTSAAVLVGVGLMALTGWSQMDPLLAIGAAGYIAWSGLSLLRRSAYGLMDPALPPDAVALVETLLQDYAGDGIQYHALRTRQAGARSFVSVHIQVPGDWSVQRGHDLLEALEHEIRTSLPSAAVFTHLEPIEDPASWRDQQLDRPVPEAGRPEGQ